MRQHLNPPEQISDRDGYHSDRSADSLLNLVQPELVSLSKYWLAALRDHALLALPSDFASQLPQDGGAFYNSDAISTTRPHYQKAWSPIVYAAALWLNNGGFATVEKNLDGSFGTVSGSGPVLPGMGTRMSAPQGKSSETLKEDYFHLILGEDLVFNVSPSSFRELHGSSIKNICSSKITVRCQIVYAVDHFITV